MGALTRPHARRQLGGALALVVLATTLYLTTGVAAGAEQRVAASNKQDTSITSQLKHSLKPAQTDLHSTPNNKQQDSAQQVAEKKQGDQSIESLFNTDEYVQIKPEEISKELDGATLALADTPQSQAPPSASGSASGPQQQQPSQQLAVAEHKSAVDDELSAHLAQEEPISSLESAGPRAYAAPADSRAARPQYAPARGGYMAPRGPPSGYPRGGPKPRPYGPAAPMGGAYGPRGPRSPHGPPRYGGPPAPLGGGGGGYSSLKGKIADGISSMVPHAARPYGSPTPLAPVPHRYHSNSRPTSAYHASSSSVAHPPRYLPRGAAAGYAAFREFVRAQAHRYKQQNAQMGSLGSHEPLAYNAAPPAPAPVAPSYGAPATGQLSGGAGDSYRNAPAPSGGKPYGGNHQDEHKSAELNYDSGASGADGAYGQGAKPQTKTKVTVAQAYIPQAPVVPAGPAASAQAGGYGSGPGSVAGQSYASGASSAAVPVNPVLAKLYGAHAPQGVGRPEYNKDYGMVIHYPQATVYTEPMTVDQLHKLAGSSIGQILEQLQYNIASGHRDEGNTLRANNKHHLGHGVSIHAKEYYAPGKHGQYVPTTAAVISTSSGASSGGSKYGGGEQAQPQDSGAYASEVPAPLTYSAGQQPQQQSGYGSAPQNVEAAAYGLKPELGSGYDRVKAAVAASAQQGGNKYNGGGGSQPPQQQQHHQRPSGGYEMQTSGGLIKPYEPLGHIANLIGSELESLYNKANSVLAKQIDPEIHAHVQAHLKTLSKVASPLKMSEHEYGSPLVLRPTGGGSGGGGGGGGGGSSYGGPRPHPSAPHMRQRAPRGRPSNSYGPPSRGPHGRHPPRPSGYAPHPQQQQRPPRPGHSGSAQSNYQQQQQQQQQQAFQQQMNQMLHDFNLGEENYGAKGQPIQAANQGYPNKVIQKHYQQQQQQAQQYQQQTAHSLPYEHTDGLEIPQGPNDQIGEISELIDALKGTLEQHKPEGYGQAGPPPGSKDHGKLEDVRYLANALGQVPSYAIQVPVGHPGQQQHQQQQQQQHLTGPESAPAAYETPKKTNEYAAAGPQQQQQQHHYQQVQHGYQQQQEQQVTGPAQQYQQQQQQQQQAPAAYGPAQTQAAPQLPYQAPPAAPQAAPQNGYGSAPAAHQVAGQTAIEMPNGGYQQQQQQQPLQQSEYSQNSAAPQDSAYNQYNQQQQQQQSYGQSYGAASQQHPQPQDSYAGPALATSAEYGKLLSDLGYGPSQQQDQGQTHQHQQQQQENAGYGQVGQSHEQQQQPAQAAEHQSAQAQHAELQPQQQQAYSTSEHTQVINHLVPVQQHQQQSGGAAGDSYTSQSGPASHQQQQQQQQQPAVLQAITSSVQQQPAHQISVAAPTESQYASAQPLSSFVDSLPNDYQELLRQPAGHASLLDGATHDAQYPSATNLSSPHQLQDQQQQQQPQHYEITKTSSAYSAGSPSAQVAASPAHHHQYRHQHHQNRYHSDQPSHHLVSSASSVSASYQKLSPASSSQSVEDNSKSAAAAAVSPIASGSKTAATASGSISAVSSSSSSTSSSSTSSSTSSAASPASSTNRDTQVSQERK